MLNTIQTLEKINFWQHNNQVNLDPYPEIKSFEATHRTTESISSLHWNQVQRYSPQ